MEVVCRRQLPERPNLEQLKKQAKSLLHARAGRRCGRARTFRPAAGVVEDASPSRHARARVARRAIGDRARARIRVVECAARGSRSAHVDVRRGGRRVRPLRHRRRGRSRTRLLALHPGDRDATLQTALVLGDARRVRRGCANSPELATSPAARRVGAAALRLPHVPASRRTAAWTGSAIARGCSRSAPTRTPSITGTGIPNCRAPLSGARCHDEPHAARGGPARGRRQSHRRRVGAHRRWRRQHRRARAAASFRVDANGIPGGVPPLVYILTFAEDRPARAGCSSTAPMPNLAVGTRRRGAAARRRATLGCGDDGAARRARRGSPRRTDGHTPHTLAELHGNRDIAAWLLAHGATNELSPLERFIAACLVGDRDAADAMLASIRTRGDLRREHHLMLHGRPKAATRPCSRRCSPAGSIRTRRTRTA